MHQFKTQIDRSPLNPFNPWLRGKKKRKKKKNEKRKKHQIKAIIHKPTQSSINNSNNAAQPAGMSTNVTLVAITHPESLEETQTHRLEFRPL